MPPSEAVHYRKEKALYCTLKNRKGSANYTLREVQKKSLSKHINMGSSFEDLDATSPFLKTDLYLDAWFARYFFCLCTKKKKEKEHTRATHPAVANEWHAPTTSGEQRTHAREQGHAQNAPRADRGCSARRAPRTHTLFSSNSEIFYSRRT